MINLTMGSALIGVKKFLKLLLGMLVIFLSGVVLEMDYIDEFLWMGFETKH